MYFSSVHVPHWVVCFRGNSGDNPLDAQKPFRIEIVEFLWQFWGLTHPGKEGTFNTIS